jgi:hypothetical protein
MVGLKKPYIRKYSVISGFKAYIVDGLFIRNKIDKEFTCFGQHLAFKFIPQDEFWIDKEFGNGSETKFYIKHLLVENRMMKEGKTYDHALAMADIIEKRERKKSQLMQRYTEKKEVKTLLHKTLLKEYSNSSLMVWIVKGELVRDFLFIDFTEGGHGYVYPFIPKNEIWIDDALNPKELKYVLLHEIFERNIMCRKLKGKISLFAKLFLYKTYLNAHAKSSEIEYMCRSKLLDIDEELKKQFNLAQHT